MMTLRNLRDPISGLTHLLAAVLSVFGLILLLIKSSAPLKPWHLATFSVFGLTAIGLYVASACYHLLPYQEVRTRRLRKWDHIMIFFFIAGTYTPVCLIPLRGVRGWSLLGVMWGIVVAGLLLKLLWIGAPRALSTIIYIVMGWMALWAIYPLVQALSRGALIWFFLGGFFYTVGGVIYALKRPDPWPDRFGFHEIFHLWVMFGTGSHFCLMYRYLTQFA
jgi:hemolysin III